MKKKNKKKGFTLVELLAVVVILAVIVLLSLYAFIPLTQKARKKTFINEMETYVKGVDAYYAEGIISDKGTIPGCYTKKDGTTECSVDIDKLKDKYIDKSGDNKYKGCINFKVYGTNVYDKKISMSNGAFKYMGDATNINEEDVTDGNDAATCYDFVEEEMRKETSAVLAARKSGGSKENYYAYANQIEEIEFVNHKNIKKAVKQWNVSEDGSNSIVAWIVNSNIDNTKYKLYIGSEKEIYAPKNSSYLFSGFYNLKSIIFNNFNTISATNMSSMFYWCKKLVSLDLSSFDTSNVIDMNGLFCGCNELMELNLSGFNTSNVKDMSHMFHLASSVSGVSSLTSLELSSFDTSNVTNMSYMFNGCSSLTKLELSGFDTSNVTDMSCMFRQCYSLTSLDLSNFNTSNVTNMSSMLSECSSLTSLDLSNFNTSNVTNMNSMLSGCRSLTSLDLSNFNTSNVKGMSYIFHGCRSLESLDLSSFNTSKVTDMTGMFRQCYSLTSLDLSNFNTSNVTSFGIMFEGCGNLKSIKFGDEFVFNDGVNHNNMFYYCKKGLELCFAKPKNNYIKLQSSIHTFKFTDKYNCTKSCVEEGTC